jgi:hypothetical protein
MKAELSCIYFKYDSNTENDDFMCIQVNQNGRRRRPVVMPESLPALYAGPVKLVQQSIATVCHSVTQRQYILANIRSVGDWPLR